MEREEIEEEGEKVMALERRRFVYASLGEGVKGLEEEW